MSEGFNRVTLLGNLGADPELKSTQSGTSILKLRLATSERYVDRDGQRQERTEWHSITIWGKRGEALHRYLSKGSRILVEGSIRTSNYEDRDGNKRYRTEIVASNVVFAGGGERRAPEPEPDPNRPPPAGQTDEMPPNDDIPF